MGFERTIFGSGDGTIPNVILEDFNTYLGLRITHKKNARVLDLKDAISLRNALNEWISLRENQEVK